MMETDECVCGVMSDSGMFGVATESLGGPCLPFPLSNRKVIEKSSSPRRRASAPCAPSTAIKSLN